MATVKTRRRADGTSGYRVVWRDGGSRDGAWESETFARKADAGRFRRDVDLAGQRWPDGWVKRVGYTDADAADVVGEAVALTLLEFGRGYVRDLTGITPPGPAGAAGGRAAARCCVPSRRRPTWSRCSSGDGQRVTRLGRGHRRGYQLAVQAYQVRSGAGYC